MNFSAFSIRHPIPAILLFILLSIAGILSFRAIGVQDFPDIELPMVTVEVTLPGAAPATLETEVARKLENSIATLQGVKNIYTKILEGVVVIMVEFVLEKNAMEAVNDVRDAVTRVRADLPADVREPTILRATTAGRPLMTYALTSSRIDQEALSWFIDNTVAKQLLTVNGVGRVKRMGGLNREIRVELDPARMAALRVTAADVSRRLRLIQQEAPGGRGDIGGAEQAVRTIATAETAHDLGKIDLSLADGRRVRLDQIATISDTTAERRSIALVNGKPVVAFEIMRSKGANEVTVARDVRQVIESLKAAYPDIVFSEQIDNVAMTEENFDASMNLLYEGAILAVLVVWYFLRDWRATIVSAAALPLSILPAFLGMYLFGFTLNMVTLTSLALVVGILVDDAIVEVENIARHLQMGKTPFQAAMDAADEIGMAVIATTFALVAVFLPTAFMDGVPGKFFKQFGWTAVLAIMASLVVARLLTPMMSAYLMKPLGGKHAQPRPDSWVMRHYLKTVSWCLDHRLITMFFAFAFFAGSLALVPLLPKGFVPPADRGQTMVNIERAPGSTLEDTLRAAELAKDKLSRIPEVRSVFSSVGAGVSGDVFARGSAAEVRKATLTVTLNHRSDRSKTQQEVEADIRDVLANEPGVRITVGAQDVGVKMQIVLQSEDPLALSKAAQAAERDLRTLNGVGGVTSSASLVRPELIVRPDFARAADLGVTAQSIAETLRIATSGDYDVGLAKLNLAERQIPIRVKLPDVTRTDIAALERLTVPGRFGPTLLGNVATFTMDSGPAQIDRLNRSRNVILDVELGGRPLGEVFAEAMALPSLSNLPPGVRLAELGDTKEMQALFASFGLAMMIGLLCIYMILVLLFHDFLQPITILGALPLSIGGAFVGLLLTGKSFSMPSLIGLLMLMGVVTKNSILLVEYAITARRKGMLRNEALMDACHKRARPIVMTTIAMIAGMIPIAIGWGSDPSFRSPMAIAVIGGLMTSTLLSLLVIPAVFTYIDDLDQWLRRIRIKLFGDKAVEQAL
jgi:multidrug efflux pump subunit AcrB